MKKTRRFGTLFLAVMMVLQTVSPSIARADDPVDRAPLQALVTQAQALDGRDYTNATWHTLLETLQGARAVLADQDITQADADGAYTTLRAAVSSLVPIASFGNPFHDVTRNDWYYGAVLYANANALMRGTTATSFAPHGTLSRATVVTVLYRRRENRQSRLRPFLAM